MLLKESPYGIITPDGVIGHQEAPEAILSPFVKTDGPMAVEWLKRVGVALDPWQCYVLDHMLGRRETGLWSARTMGLVIARQNGKTELAAARILLGLFLFKEKKVMYSAHRRDTVLEVFDRVCELIRQSPLLKKRLAKNGIRLRNGDEAITTKDGCRAQFKVRKKNSGRGFSAPCLIVDEAMECGRDFLGDVMPTMSAMKNAQMIAMGSAGNPDSEAFGDLRRRAYGENRGAMTWLEWSIELCDEYCEDDCGHIDPYSIEAFRLTNPAYGIRISHEAITDELATMQGDLSNFHRERLSVGDWPVDVEAYSIITRHAWESATLAPELALPVGKVVFAVSMSEDRTSTIITAVSLTQELCFEHEECRQRDGDRHAVVQVLPDSERGGTSWVFDRLVELKQKWKPYGIAIDSRGQASTLIDDLERKKIRVYSPSSLEYAQACAEFAVGISGTKKQKGYIHHIGDTMLTDAVAGVTKRKLSGLWAWARATDLSDIVPLESATLGVWGLQRAIKESKMRNVNISRMGG